MLERFHAWAAKAQPYALPYWRFNPGLQQLQSIVGLSQPCVGLQRFGKPQAPTLLLGIQAARELGTARVIDQRQDKIPLSRLSKGDMKYDRIWLAGQAGGYAEGLAQINDSSALVAIVEKVLADNPKAVEDYKSGKTNVAGFLVGQCMKASRGQGNPATLRDMVLAAIEKL